MSCSVEPPLPPPAQGAGDGQRRCNRATTSFRARRRTIRHRRRSLPGPRPPARSPCASCCCRRRGASDSGLTRSPTRRAGRRRRRRRWCARSSSARLRRPHPTRPRAGATTEHNLARFRSADIYEASHILIAARARSASGVRRGPRARPDNTVAARRRAHPVRRTGNRPLRLPLGGFGRKSRADHGWRHHAGVREGSAGAGAGRDERHAR